MSIVFAVDPGPVKSGWARIDTADCRIVECGIAPSCDIVALASWHAEQGDIPVVEMVQSYGAPVGQSIFDTVVVIGRLVQAVDALLVKRGAVKQHLVPKGAKRGDSQVIQALVDRFAAGEPSRGRNGWFRGVKADIWQAVALGVYAADLIEKRAILSWYRLSTDNG